MAVATFAVVSATAQTSESLLNILEQKGILTSEQAAAIRQEALTRESAAKAEAAKAKPTPPTSSLRFAGELRLRHEGFYGDNPEFIDRGRFRLRLRTGIIADVSPNVEVGVRLTTGVNEGEPTGNNATFQDNASKKSFALDLAYAKWTALKTADTSVALIGGKMNNPFTSSDLVFDADYTPEGFALQAARALNAKHSLKANAAYFILDEAALSAHDPYLVAGQLRLDSTWSKAWSTTFGVTALGIGNADRLTNLAVPDVHKGNTRTIAGVLVNDYAPWVLDFGITRTLPSVAGYPGAFPVRLCGDYMTNPQTDRNDTGYYVGLYMGKTAKRGTWELNYRYRVLEADAWYEELADSDSGAFYQLPPPGGSIGYGGGTNVRGHIIAGSYALTDYALLGFTYFITDLINPSPAGSESGMQRIQTNVIVKF